ncbi:NUDIX domain-containing protein [Candidatus Dojkabacteria bacterium]|uniref:NUDIX domain-containing protein n=1 Tax=Candidatus Dojkabacteria bacterium TaxID=2099670 RepID=A0A955L8H0_9BACT|nr:NUDIX domain-containing protein [Candidatus Dojkabacteria bacterium]
MHSNPFTFCPHCSGETISEVSEGKLLCSQCEFILYFNPSPCIALVTFSPEDKLLLTRRAKNPGQGKLGLPGGFCEHNETFEQTLKREVREELSVSLSDIHYLTSKFDTYEYKGITYSTLCVIFTAKLATYELDSISDELDDILYYNLRDVPLEELAFASQIELIKELQNK